MCHNNTSVLNWFGDNICYYISNVKVDYDRNN